MIIRKHGIVILTEGTIRVEGWNCEIEPGDPTDVTPDQLLLQTAVKWALAKLNAAVKGAAVDQLQRKRAAQKPIAVEDIIVPENGSRTLKV